MNRISLAGMFIICYGAYCSNVLPCHHAAAASFLRLLGILQDVLAAWPRKTIKHTGSKQYPVKGRGGGDLNSSSVLLSFGTVKTGPFGLTSRSRQQIRGRDSLAKYLMGNYLCARLIYRLQGNDCWVIQQTIDAALWETFYDRLSLS